LERPESEDQVRRHLFKQAEAKRISAQEMLNLKPRLVILGDPGSGKSTLVNYVCHLLAMANLDALPVKWIERLRQTGPWEHGHLMPIRIVLREFFEWLQNNGIRQAAAEGLKNYLQKRLSDDGMKDIWPRLHELLQSQSDAAMIFLDGLDEVPSAARAKVVRIIDDFAARYRHNRFLVTCRIYAYIGDDYQLRRFHQATLTPFNTDQMKAFVQSWYQQLSLQGRLTRKEAQTRTGLLVEAARRPDLQGLAERPLLLTVMALLHTWRGQLPDDRVELYQWTVDLLLQRWEGRSGNDQGILEILAINGLKMSDLEAALHDVAFYAHNASADNMGAADIPEGALRERVAPYLDEDWNKAGDFVAYVRERTGLLIRHKPDAYTFPHRTFPSINWPVEAINRFKQLKAGNTLAILIVLYGNRDFDDALSELKNLAIELGFNPVAGGAFIGEHSFATKDVPIANGRPDSLDVQKAMDFGAKIKDKITALQSPDAQMDLEIPGRFPYKAGGAQSMDVSPVSIEATCTVCGTCAGVCPTEAISIDESVETAIELCIRCCACIKNCPTGSRVMEEGKWKDIAYWLNENCSTRKEPQIFGVDG